MPIVDVIRKRVRTATLERPGATVRTSGYAAEGVPTTSEIEAHVQPLSPQELRSLPPGQNGTDIRNVWSETELKRRDYITIDSKRMLIDSVEYWPEGPFYRARAVITEDVLP